MKYHDTYHGFLIFKEGSTFAAQINEGKLYTGSLEMLRSLIELDIKKRRDAARDTTRH